MNNINNIKTMPNNIYLQQQKQQLTNDTKINLPGMDVNAITNV